MKTFTTILIFIAFQLGFSQETKKKLPYYEIPEASESYTAGAVVARMIDGLGFRYYWATEGLTEKDLAFKPSEEGRTTSETIDHIYGLTSIILNSAIKQPSAGSSVEGLTFEEKREKTLQMLKEAADIFRNESDLANFNIVFKRDSGLNEFPFWNMINGPIADALWHCGQVISHRRTTGNPYNSKANVLTGKVRG